MLAKSVADILNGICNVCNDYSRASRKAGAGLSTEVNTPPSREGWQEGKMVAGRGHFWMGNRTDQPLEGWD